MRSMLLFLVLTVIPFSAVFALHQYSLENAVVFSEREIAAYELERMDALIKAQKKKLETLFGTNIAGKPEIRFASTLEDFTSGRQDWRIGGFYERGRITLQPLDTLKRKKSLEKVVVHEYNHFFLDSNYPSLPFYVNEGISSFLDGSVLDRIEPVLPENILDWGMTALLETSGAEKAERCIGSSRGFIGYLAGPGGAADIKTVVNYDGNTLAVLYRRYYESSCRKVRVLINPRGEKRITLLFGGVCRSVTEKSSSAVMTNYFTNRLEIDASEGKFYLNDIEADRADLQFDGGFTAGEYSYRGGLKLSFDGKDFLAVNVLPLEYYLYGVVASEMPSTNIEALKAQAVLCRGVALFRMTERKDKPYDVLSLTSDQSYRGSGWETPSGIRAVRETEGLVMTFNDRLVYPFYFSTCSGWTALSQDVWEKELPHVKAVECGNLCSASPHYPEWERTISFHELSEMTGTKNVRTLEAVVPDPHGRARAVKINGEEIPFDRFKAMTAKKKGWNFLKSNLITVKENNGGFVITGKGLGHGVGLCQYGAIKLAEKKDFRQIIDFYFSNVTVRPWKEGDRIISEE